MRIELTIQAGLTLGLTQTDKHTSIFDAPCENRFEYLMTLLGCITLAYQIVAAKNIGQMMCPVLI